MSKNLTRKGIAFGAIVALGTTLFAGAPASAAGIDNGSVSLAPRIGAEYDITAGAEFDLKANFANAAKTTGAWLKFLVEDSSSKSSVVFSGSSQYSVTTDGTADLEVVNAGGADSAKDLVKVYIAVADHKLKAGDRIALTSVADANDGATGKEIDDAADFWTIASVESTYVTFEVPSDSYAAALNGGSAGTGVNDALTMSVVSSARSATGSYVFDTKSDTNSADKNLRLDSTDEDVTQSVSVTAWVDNNDNGLIDTTEYQSPARTVRFLKHADVTAAVSFNPIAVGADSTVVTTVTFSPTLNGSQLIAANNLNGAENAVAANFTRPGSTKTLASASTSYSNTTKQWTITSVDMNNAAADDVEVAGAQNNGWAITQPTAQAADAATKIAISAANIVTITTTAAHGLQVGDRVVVANSTGNTRVNSSTTAGSAFSTVLSVPTTTKFTYKEVGTSTTAVAEVADADVTVAVSGGETKILRNFAVAGTYSAQVLLYKDAATNALTKLGSAASSTGVAVSADSATIESVSSATVSATSSDAASVYTGTKTAAFVGKVLDEDGAAVGAGLDAAITATTVTSAGTVKINGTTVVTGTVVYAKTDANGQVAISVENSSALAGESIVLDLDIQGVDATDVTATWGDKVYSIVDLNDPSVISSPARTRAVAEGASYTFSLLVQDQFKAPAGADLRLKAVVTGNTEFQQIVSLSSGKASLAVADGGLTTGDAVVALSIEKLTGSTWAALADASGVVWGTDASGSGDEVGTVAIKYYTQTDALTLNADAANYPSTTAADFAAATSTKSLVAVDARVSNTAPTAVVSAGKAVVSGAVTNVTTGAAKSGQVVTVSGAGLLFKSGDVWTIGSASQIAADGTFAFEVYSNNPGTKVVTVTSGSLTKTASLVFTGASSAVRTLTVSGTQKVLPGSTLQAQILLVDGNGNGVDTTAPATTPASEYISVSYEGPGLLSGSALPTETDKDGKASVRYLLGTGDRGVATVTVKFDKNFDGDFIDATDITVVREYLIGVSAKIVKPAKGATATVKNALGATIKVVRGSKSTTKVATSNTQKVTLKSGTGKVNVYVNGVKVASK